MLNLSKTIFGRLFTLNHENHFITHGLNYLFQNKEYHERFEINTTQNIRGHLDFNLINNTTYKTNIQLFSPNFELTEQIINDTQIPKYKHNIKLYYGCDYYKYNKNVDFDDLPVEIIEILDIKNNLNINFCSCCGKDSIYFV
jgi:hypothetical protein